LALGNQPDYVTLVPERREEVTTEGGLIPGPIDRMMAVVDKSAIGRHSGELIH
jgi:pyridoxine 5-phosphate synthase